jgi:hypothetical protein
MGQPARLLDCNWTVPHSILQQKSHMKYDHTHPQYLHFSVNHTATEDCPSYDRLWKLRYIFDVLNDCHSKYYTLPKHLTVHEVQVLSAQRVNLKHYICMTHKRFGIKIYKLCNISGYTYTDMYLGQNRTPRTADMTVTLCDWQTLHKKGGTRTWLRDFQLVLVHNLIKRAERLHCSHWHLRRPSVLEKQVT